MNKKNNWHCSIHIYIYIYHLDFYIEIGSNSSRDSKYKAFTCTGSIWAVKLHCLYTFLLYTVTNKIYCFLVPDSCWATIRNGNSISADVAESTIKTIITTLISALIDNLAVVLGFSHYTRWTQYTYIVGKYKSHFHSLQNRTEQFAKD